jgi:glutamine phosphoribosylpyrophosphate amidotransferase
MCGIVGYWPVSPSVETAAAFARLFRESTIRGLHAFGIAQPSADGALAVTRAFHQGEVIARFDPERPAIAHARYSTSGDWHVSDNNQPVVAAGMALAMNGVISMATKGEFEAAFGVDCEHDNDAEIFLRRLEAGQAAESFLTEMVGSFAGVWLRAGQLYAGRNARRPLWACEAYGARWRVSTRDILRRAGFPVDLAQELGPGTVEVVGW